MNVENMSIPFIFLLIEGTRFYECVYRNMHKGKKAAYTKECENEEVGQKC